jgi:hypothetical protein
VSFFLVVVGGDGGGWWCTQVDMGMASQIYFLVSYGQEMERQDGPAQHCVFILVQVLPSRLFHFQMGRDVGGRGQRRLNT